MIEIPGNQLKIQNQSTKHYQTNLKQSKAPQNDSVLKFGNFVQGEQRDINKLRSKS
jgi:hypothetical protein